MLRSGWLTTGPMVRRFEEEFARATDCAHALAVNSATAALHLALEALGVKPGDRVLVPTMTFAATAEVVRYLGAVPLLVDCEARHLLVDLADAGRKASGRSLPSTDGPTQRGPVVGLIPVHVGGIIVDPEGLTSLARDLDIWLVEDAAHSLSAAWRSHPDEAWRGHCGNGSAAACFSFYPNKPITTGEGGMIVTQDSRLADRMRTMSLHGLSSDAWRRRSSAGSWDYEIVAPGFKYNMTDIAAAIGIHQLARSDEMRAARQAVAESYVEGLGRVEEIELPGDALDRIHSWHLYPIRLRLERLKIDRHQFIQEMAALGIRCSVHWRPLHLHPYYQETFGWGPEHCPVATREWQRLVSLPVFPSMTPAERRAVIDAVTTICGRCAK